ncbi:MarR family winged helix-turn-helix transcriptional regulator [Hyphomicrobium sp.]|uniref:MarR family winged helix-turn-helix transcriptional regulator n=1 Tax=Hyphomicrobium sp. TaxID=82 RepID=UPI002E336788|nr:MarR family winged helix-turn-helix transcriptional regulator [Hyphomicrobium sp.]HEX2842264.1 MarR family winged helix-turn-helix transcriptional regulator [Hyphomicrobium sp.]
MLSFEIRELLLQLGRGMLAERSNDALTTAQWFALRFFSRANLFSRTLSELAAYQATTRGTASQTIKSLEELGYIKRERSTHDGRSSILSVTDKARALMDEDPLASIFKEIDALDEQDQKFLRNILRQLVGQLGSESRKTVGTCGDCVFLLMRRLSSRSHGTKSDFFCQCNEMPVNEADLKLLCTSFRAKYETRA